ncbi:hypothetical protein [Flavobacterium sp.]|nr:hypothetical protein [Flavobacterium sp.]
MIRKIEGKDVLTDYSVKYDDNYVKINGKWLIKDRVANFVVVKSNNLP